MNEKIFQVLQEKVLNDVTIRLLEYSQTMRGENQPNQCSTPPRKAKIVSAVQTRVIASPNSRRLPDNAKNSESAHGADGEDSSQFKYQQNNRSVLLMGDSTI